MTRAHAVAFATLAFTGCISVGPRGENESAAFEFVTGTDIAATVACRPAFERVTTHEILAEPGAPGTLRDDGQFPEDTILLHLTGSFEGHVTSDPVPGPIRLRVVDEKERAVAELSLHGLSGSAFLLAFDGAGPRALLADVPSPVLRLAANVTALACSGSSWQCPLVGDGEAGAEECPPPT